MFSCIYHFYSLNIKQNFICCRNKTYHAVKDGNNFAPWKRDFVLRAFKINQKTNSLKPPRLTLSEEIQKSKVPAAMYGIGREKLLRASLSSVWTVSQMWGGGGRTGMVGKQGSEPRKTGRGVRERGEFSRSCPAWGQKYVALSSSQRHQPSILACHYFTSCRGHTPSLRHAYAHWYYHTPSVLPWSNLKHGQVEQNE